MHLWLKLISFSLILSKHNMIILEQPEHPEFTFDSIALGHKGILITWKPNGKQNEEIGGSIFNFKTDIIADEEKRTVSFSTESSSEGSHKIHSLNANTLYKVIITHYSHWKKLDETYIVEQRTNSESNSIPKKPDFEFKLNKPYFKVKWFPCGRERNCRGKEAGTHFGVKFRMLDLREEYVHYENFTDYFGLEILIPGHIYEIVVISVNGISETHSDAQEIFPEPSSTAVRWVKAVSLPNASVLISWEPPRYSFETLKGYYIYGTPKGEISYNIREIYHLKMLRSGDVPHQQFVVHDVKPTITHTFFILPHGKNNNGLIYIFEYTPEIYGDDLPIAKPDLIYRKSKNDLCNGFIKWLPCGQVHACRNTKPGSKFTIDIRPEPLWQDNESISGKFVTDGYIIVEFDPDITYYVTITSWHETAHSDSVTREFENCSSISD